MRKIYPIHRECANCSIKFLIPNAQYKTKKFCTKSCAAVFNNKIRPISSRNKQSETLKKTLSKNNNGISLTKIIYKNRCRFTFNPYQVKNVTGYNLLLEHGIWHPLNNPLGVSRDHIISQEYGWRNNIDPKIISHPANCQWLHQIDNARKKSDSWITLELLLGRIHIWDESVNQINKEIVIKIKSKPVYKWVLYNIRTNEISETTCITKWSMDNGLSKSRIYQSNCDWKIKQKTKI